MESSTRYLRIRTVAATGLAALVLVLGLGVARADTVRASDEPWYRQTSAETRQRARELFAQALDKHQQLLRGEALEFYEQALALWDNPDIRWNLALVLEDLGQYLRAYQELEGALHWEAALGAERLRNIRDRMRVLETQRLVRIEAYGEESGAEIKLDGQPWPRSARGRSALVLPGEHYISATKPGYFPVTRSATVVAGQHAYVALSMDADRLIETRRWSAWKPWAVVAAGAVVVAVGTELERRVFARRAASEDALTRGCSTDTCEPISISAVYDYDRGKLENRLAIGALAVGGAAVVVGLTLAWLNQPRAHRAEPRAHRAEPRALSRIELVPMLSSQRAELSARVRF